MSALGRRYASALLDLAREQYQTERVVRDVSALLEVWRTSEELREIVANPVVPRPALKGAVLAVVDRLGIRGLVRNTIGLLADRGRLAHLGDVLEACDELSEGERGRLRAEVTTPRPMPESYYEQLRGKLEQITGREIVIVHKEDPSLIGGVVTRIGDRVFDGSLSNRLAELRENLLANGQLP